MAKMQSMKRGRYVGPLAELRGKTCLTLPHDTTDGLIRCQFDEKGLKHPVTNVTISYMWHDFELGDIEVLPWT
jgi:hypothetical protein